MANEKIIKSRQQQKIDTVERWQEAGEKGFVPKAGEIIIYSDVNKIKVGDGDTNINNLKFFSDIDPILERLENMPFEYLIGTEENPILLRNLENGIYYIEGFVQYNETAAIFRTSTGLFIVQKLLSSSKLIRFAPEAAMLRCYTIYDDWWESYPIELTDIETALNTANNAVSFATKQNLTEVQKKQACDNINAIHLPESEGALNLDVHLTALTVTSEVTSAEKVLTNSIELERGNLYFQEEENEEKEPIGSINFDLDYGMAQFLKFNGDKIVTLSQLEQLAGAKPLIILPVRLENGYISPYAGPMIVDYALEQGPVFLDLSFLEENDYYVPLLMTEQDTPVFVYNHNIISIVGENVVISKGNNVGEFFIENTEDKILVGEIFNNYETNVASGNYSHAEGSNTIAAGYGSHAEGSEGYNEDGTLYEKTFEFDDPSGLGPQAFIVTGPYAHGSASHAEGLATLAYGSGAHAEGTETLAAGGRSHAEGTRCQALGHRSHAEGGDTIASGKDSHAEGTSTLASGSASHAEGNGTQAIGTYAHAEGTASIASGRYTHAEGGITEARGNYSHAEGWHTVAHGYQHVQGKYNDIGANYSSSSTSGTVGKGTGDNAYIIFDSAEQNLAEGKFIMTNPGEPVNFPPNDTKCFTRIQYLCGNNSTTQYFQFTETPTAQYDDAQELTGYKGPYITHKINFTNYAHVIGNGSSSARSNAHTIDWNGNGWYAGNITVGSDKKKVATEEYINDKTKTHYVVAGRKADTTAGERSTAEGKDTTASGYSAHAEGYNTSAEGRSSHAEGGYTKTDITAEYAHAEGNNTLAQGLSAHAEGKGTVASGKYSHAEGRSDDKALYTASGEASHVEGINTRASGAGAHAEGVSTKAEGQASHAEGDAISRNSVGGSRFGPIAYGRASHAEGTGTVAGIYGDANICASHAEGVGSQSLETAAHAEGFSTIANAVGQHVQGKYNIADTSYAHIVGNGSGEDVFDEEGNITTQNRSNAHTLDWDGNAWYAGSVEATALILKSPNGSRFKITVSDSGELNTTKL